MKTQSTKNQSNKNRIEFTIGNNVIVFTHSKTSNKKISDGKNAIVQTYTYSRSQYNYVQSQVKKGQKVDFKTFFSLDKENCLDCPLSGNMRESDKSLTVKCYTNKVMQFSGFISQLKSIIANNGNFENLPTYEQIRGNEFFTNKIVNKYVRFGTYGEPTIIPFELVQSICEIALTWTGYTHQYLNKSEYLNYFMASAHSERQMNAINGRSFVAINPANNFKNAVHCPASDESGFKSTCEKCGLCSGIKGKGKKSVKIFVH